jgi:hypothetical protein
MSLSHQTLTLYASATVQINPIAGTIPDYCEGMTLSVQNLHAIPSIILTAAQV